MFASTYWEAFCDGDLNVEEEDSGPESSTDSNGLLRVTEHTAHTGRKWVSSIYTQIYIIKYHK